MPFLVYEKENNFLIKKKEVSLAGKNGPVCSLVMRKVKMEQWNKNYKDDYAIGWEITDRDLLRELGFTSSNVSLIIDLKPNVKNNVSLYYLRKIWGFSYYGWSPVALQLETVYVDKQVDNPKKFKNKVALPKDRGDLVHEFLYLQGGIKEGSWVWGRIGSVNGCLLWPDAFNFFIEKILPYTR